ncbi:hypothetical protein HZB89_02495 [archaeon]|nr:hypothetical protein [archaeon]
MAQASRRLKAGVFQGVESMNKFILFPVLFLLLFSADSFAAQIQGNFDFKAFQCQTAEAIALIENNSSSQKDFSLSVEGQLKNWVVLAPEQLSIPANSSREAYLFVTANCYAAAGNYAGKLAVNDGFSTATKDLQLEVIEGHSISLSLENPSIDSCQGTEAVFKAKLKNTGRFDETIKLSVSGLNWQSSFPESAILPQGSEKTIDLKFKSLSLQEPKDYSFTLKAANEFNSINESIQGKIILSKCFGLQATFNQFNSFCIDSDKPVKASALIALKNTGTKALNLNYSVSGDGNARLSKPAETIQPNSESSFEAFFTQLPLIESSKALKLDIASNDLMKSEQLNFSFNKCFDLSLDKSSIDLCECANTEQELTVKNNSAESNTYKLSFNPSWVSSAVSSISLAGGQEAGIPLAVISPCNSSAKEITAVFSNQSKSIEKKISLNYLSNESCFGIQPSLESISILVARNSGKKLALKLKNNGLHPQKLLLEAKGVDFMHVLPKELSLNAGEEKEAYLFFSPSLQAELKEFTASLNITSEFPYSKQIPLTITVVEEGSLEATELEDIKEEDFNLDAFEALESQAGSIESQLDNNSSTASPTGFLALGNAWLGLGILALLALSILAVNISKINSFFSRKEEPPKDLADIAKRWECLEPKEVNKQERPPQAG